MGLFQDLLKANPFDEQFRKAAEQNKAASITLPLVRNTDGGSDRGLWHAEREVEDLVCCLT